MKQSFLSLKLNPKDGLLNLLRGVLLSPLMGLISLPIFIIRDFCIRFIFAKDTAADPVISYSNYKSHGGQIYWYWNSHRFGKYGIFGYDFLAYGGSPTSFFDFPLSSWLIHKWGYKRVVMMGMVLLGIGVFLHFHAAGSEGSVVFPLIIALLVVFSNIVIEHIIVGTYELLPWGLLALAFFSYQSGFFVLAGILLGGTGLAHIGVMSLGVFYICLFAILQGGIVHLAVTGAVTFLVSAFWLVPCLVYGAYSARSAYLETIHRKKYSRERLIQLFIYLLFCITLFIYHPGYGVLPVFLPVFISLYNEKVKWMYSPYTIRLYMLLVGSIQLSFNFNPYSCGLLILCFGYMHPRLITNLPAHLSGCLYHFRNIRLGGVKEKIETVFHEMQLKDNVAFEKSLYHHIYYNSFLGFVLRGKMYHVFNTGVAEVYNHTLFKSITSKLAPQTFDKNTIEKLQEYGINYMVAYTEAFKNVLMDHGFQVKKSIDIESLFERETFDKVRLPRSFYLLKMESDTTGKPGLILTAHDMHCLIFRITQPGKYLLNYQQAPGIVVSLNNRRIPAGSDDNGYITVTLDDIGELSICYSRKEFYRSIGTKLFKNKKKRAILNNK